jgi:IS5 family transposase
MTPELLTEQEETVHGDSGYLGAEKRTDAIVWNNQGRKLNI